MRIIDRSIVLDLAKLHLITSFVFIVILVPNEIIRLVEKVKSGELTPDTLLVVLPLFISEILTMSIPISLGLTLFIYIRSKFISNDIYIWMSSGMSFMKVLRLSMIYVFIVATWIAFFSFWLIPTLFNHGKTIVLNTKKIEFIKQLTPNTVHILDKKTQTILLVKKVVDDKALGVIVETGIGENKTYINADSSYVAHKNNNNHLVLENGTTYKLSNGLLSNEVKFSKITIHNKEFDKTIGYSSGNFYTDTLTLIESDSKDDKKELYRRISEVLIILVIPFLIIPFTYLSPREKNSSGVAKSILAIILYSIVNKAILSTIPQNTSPMLIYANSAFFICIGIWITYNKERLIKQ
jgi:lipopolysaccharide export LptBFGC system permease protein LptF